MTLRHMTRRSLRRDLDVFAEVYNAAWAGNWGFVPYSKEDLDAYALDLQLVFDPKWFMVVETPDGDVAGVAISPLDVNQVLQRMKGGLLPTGWFHYLRRQTVIDRIRVGFLGVKPEYQHTGVAAMLYVEHYDKAVGAKQHWAECGLDPRGQPDQQGDGGARRTRREALPRVRAAAARRGRRSLTIGALRSTSVGCTA